jgi:hypothetical protein
MWRMAQEGDLSLPAAVTHYYYVRRLLLSSIAPLRQPRTLGAPAGLK